MTTFEERKQIKHQRSYLHKWLLSEQNQKKIIESHFGNGGIAEIYGKSEIPIKNLSCNFRIWFTKERGDIENYVIVKFKYTCGEEDFVDAMRSLKRQMKIQHELNNESFYRENKNAPVKGSILTLDNDTKDDAILKDQGITIIRIGDSKT